MDTQVNSYTGNQWLDSGKMAFPFRIKQTISGSDDLSAFSGTS